MIRVRFDSYKTKCILPDLPSELLKVAMDDFEKVERDSRYVISMASWHKPRSKNQSGVECAVCFAGAVMAETCKMPTDEIFDPTWEEEDKNNRKFRALNLFRIGQVRNGLWLLGSKYVPSNAPRDRHIVNYDADSQTFKDQMRLLAQELREAGL